MNSDNFYIGIDDEFIVPDIPTTILGYRQWKYNPATKSIKTRVPWPPDEVLKAECKAYISSASMWGAFSYGYISEPKLQNSSDKHAVPNEPDAMIAVDTMEWDYLSSEWIEKESNGDRMCEHPNPGCGIYAYKSFEDLCHRPFYSSGVHDVITGIVELGGRVWPHERGWRAEYGLVKGIYPIQDYDYELAELYGADIVEPPTSDDMEWLLNKYNRKRRDYNAEKEKDEETDG
jgi:hypothetical protein